MKILFLCTELAGYFTNCIQSLKEETEAEIRVIHWPISPLAPFLHQLERISMYDKTKYSWDVLHQECIAFAPSLVYVAGWVDKDYKKTARKLRQMGSKIVCGFDNPWKGSLRQQLLCALSPFIIKPYYEFMWVPGKRQFELAKKLGYRENEIITGLYVADIDKFIHQGKKIFDKQLLFVGRLDKMKGIQLLVEAFSSLEKDERNGWKLKIIGNGPLMENIQSSEEISLEEFMQPEELKEKTKDAGGFVLPSLEEHWGVVVQEFAAAGLPLILSDQVCAGEQFLIEGQNGFTFKSGDTDSLKNVLKRFFKLNENEIRNMGRRSNELAKQNSTRNWVSQLLSLNRNQN